MRLAPESIQQLEGFVTLFIPHAFCWKHLCNTGEELPSRSSSEELAEAMKSHDLVIYIGHGSAVKYVPMHQIQSLENCAATLLMGCSSGCLTLNGCYIPHGPALSYLLAGSPVTIYGK
ncbi:separase-like [Pyrus x bretschneideri]|uniref:separase-like n=1 Tax=Pyrus x bretschneideri TaxID=225117 RepID=UPI00202F0051|nr:separase-like [Pyrus x bretschneideri]